MFTFHNSTASRVATPRKLSLRRDDMWKFELAKGSLPIRCEHGSVWITREGLPRDVVLPEGGEYEVDGTGLVILSAVTDAVVTVGADLSAAALAA